MTISGQPATNLLDSVLKAQDTQSEINVAVLKKAQDVEKAQGAALVNLLEKSVPPAGAQHLDVYA